ncbi:MAG: DEAD/DEAH box helicase [Clostridia bacterium]|nr:DEAD/DEAH box helicase [Clostridia bacterium]
MADFAPGMRVLIRDEEWMIRKCDKNSYNTYTLQCVGVSPLVRDKTAYFLSDLEKITVIDPAKTALIPDNSARFTRSRLFLESQWRQKIPTDAKLHIGHHAVMDVMPYQLEPAAISLARPRQRILMADGVGLGKTLEAGILISELIARGKGRRILVVTVKSMMAQFQKEMWERFSIPLISLDSAKIQRIRRDLPSNHNPFHYYDKTIVSIDTIKRDSEYRVHLENARWDIIVIDEAHNVAKRGNSNSQRARLADLLSSRSDTLIMLSATPHDGSARSFASLMNMLDPTAIPDPDNYTAQDIKDNGDDIKGLIVRRFKKDIQDQAKGGFKERYIAEVPCTATAKEEAALEAFLTYESMLPDTENGRLRNMTFKKAIFSSPAACLKSVQGRMGRLEKEGTEEALKERRALSVLENALSVIEPEDFSRYQELLKLLRSPEYAWNYRDTDDRLVVFTERIETMRWLAEHLKQDLRLPPAAIQTLHGGMSDIDQQKIVEEFGRNEAPVRILVASDVASEGINLHYLSHRMIHFDIPWSLMVFQQRNGRIDRYGQKVSPDIRYMVTRSFNDKIRGDIRILQVLIRKENEANKNIGDVGALMNLYDQDAEEQLTYHAMEKGSAEAFEQGLTIDEDASLEELFADLWGDTKEELLPPDQPSDKGPETVEDSTLMSDMDFLEGTVRRLAETRPYKVMHLHDAEGVEILWTPDMQRRFRNVLPPEAAPAIDEWLMVSPDKNFVAQENRHSLQNALEEDSWPKVHYLWRQHPIMQWANDKASQFFERQQAPLVGIPTFAPGEVIFCMAGTIPNRRAVPIVDEWFGLRFVNGHFDRRLTMDGLIAMTQFDKSDRPNSGTLTEADAAAVSGMLPQAVDRAKAYMTECVHDYRERVDEPVLREWMKLEDLKKRHMEHIEQKYEQLSIFGKDKRKEAETRHIDTIFDEFETWVRDSMEIEDVPYIRIVAAFTGVNA